MMTSIEENNPILADNSLEIMDKQETNYYKILELEPTAPRSRIREAYIRLKNTYSSNSQALYSVFADDEARHSLAMIEEAYKVLDDELSRQEYDRQVSRDNETVVDPFLSHQSRVIPPQDDVFQRVAGTKHRKEFSKARFAERALLPEIQAKLTEMIQNSGVISGELFKEMREQCDVDLKEITEQTKISPEYVVALEKNDFQKLPALVYVKGFLKSYLIYLGIKDNKTLVDSFVERYLEWQGTGKS